MATTKSYKLVLVFKDNNGSDVIFSYNNAKDPETIQTSDVSALVEGIITNGSIFENPPVSINKAYLVTTEEKELEV